MNIDDPPLLWDLVLIGGGHAHVHVLKMLGMPKGRRLLHEHGIRVTLIARDVHTPYSGMLPGFVSGHYSYDDIHLDLEQLCQFANVRLLHTSAVGIQVNTTTTTTNGKGRGGGYVQCSDDRPPVRYDVVSIDIGSSPSGTPPHYVIPVKPIAHFCAQYERLQQSLRVNAQSYTPDNPFTLVVVGGGAGGIELALSVQYNLQTILGQEEGASSSSSSPKDVIKIIVVTRGDVLLEQHNRGVQRIFRRVLEERNVEVRYEAEAVNVKLVNRDDGITNGGSTTTTTTTTRRKKELILSPNSRKQPPIVFDECLWCTSAGVAPWFTSQTPFDTTDDGFLTVRDTYESTSHAGVFAAGDCCHMVQHPRPKAGVFAVRAGPPLVDNLLRSLLQRPQRQFLGLLSTGDKYAIASRGPLFCMEGRFVWTWKDYIDRTWMKKYKELPDVEEMMQSMKRSSSIRRRSNDNVPKHVRDKGPQVAEAFAADPMRCGGCGAKVGATTVSRVLAAVHRRQVRRAKELSLDVMPPPIDHDDAAIVPIQGNGAMIHTIDYFRSFISDPFVFGKVSAVHALSDVHAMGAEAQTALALAVVPFAADDDITESTLIDLLSGASDVFQNEQVRLVGGHTCEGSELACGFAIHGYTSQPDRLLRKSGGKIGDKMILTKPIGTGALFAADMRAKCQGRNVTEALQSMTQSNVYASRLARDDEFGDAVHACTDVTGFGLMGHLLEMLVTSNEIGAVINIREIPFLQGALDASSDGIYSSLQPQNARNRRAVTNHVDAAFACPIEYPLLFDPQTAGGLLFFVDPDVADSFVDKLRVTFPFAAVIGELVRCTKGDDEGVCVIGGEGSNTGKRVRVEY